MPALQWRVEDVTQWSARAPESEGVRAKRWLESPSGSHWLRKHRRESRESEPAIETIALHLARSAGLPAAPDAIPARWDASTEKGLCIIEKKVPVWCDARKRSDRCTGIVVETFLESTDELSAGEAVLAAHVPDFNRDNRALHSLANVKNALMLAERDGAGADLLVDFVRLIAFDAWIGNSDRHQGNWGVVRRVGKPLRIAPVYDPASCLGAELQRGHPMLSRTRTATSLKNYAARCGSGFGTGLPGERVFWTQERVIAEVRTWPQWTDNVHAWLAAFDAAIDSDFLESLDRVPVEWLPNERRELLVDLLPLIGSEVLAASFDGAPARECRDDFTGRRWLRTNGVWVQVGLAPCGHVRKETD